MNLGENIKILRTEKGYTQYELAEKLNVHFQTVSKWERGASLPDFSMLGIIAKELDVSLEILLDVDGDGLMGEFDLVKMGKAIREHRNSLRLSQGELAKELNTSADTISKWERGLVCLDIERLLLLSKMFSVSPSSIYFGVVKIKREKRRTKKKRKPWVKWLAVSLGIFMALVGTLLFFIIRESRTLRLVYPLKSVVEHQKESPFFCDVHGRFCFNNGVWLETSVGQDVFAVMNGEIKSIKNKIYQSGVELVIEKGEYTATICSIVLIDGLEVGSKVKRGQKIGTVGEHSPICCESKFEKPCLKFYVSKDGEDINLKEFLENN